KNKVEYFSFSLFGNLRNVKRSRLTFTAKSKSHVEILWIETASFYHFLTNYSQMMKKFELLTSRQVDFIPAITIDHLLLEEVRERSFSGYDDVDM
ncbi:hypothetical protein C0J52_09701, partial [Blattella germanica]